MRFHSARRRLLLTTLAYAFAMLLVGISPLISAAAEAPATTAAPVGAWSPAAQSSKPTVSFEAWFDVEQPPTVPFEAVQLVVDFPVGSGVARHFHGGPAYITMLDGAMRMSIGNGEFQTMPAGSSFVEPYEVVAEGTNPNDTSASLLVTYLLPVGVAVTTLEQATALAGPLPPGAVPRYETRMRFDAAPAKYKVGHWLQTYEPGVWSISGEPQSARLLTVVSGEVTVLTGATQQTYTKGQHWIETPGTAWLSGNLGSEKAVVAVSTTMPRD